MTRKELVELLIANYGENDEVFVKYEDDQGECTSTVSGVEDFTQTYITKSRWEIQDRISGEWKEISNEEARRKNGCRCITDKIRYVTVETEDITRKCIVVD